MYNQERDISNYTKSDVVHSLPRENTDWCYINGLF